MLVRKSPFDIFKNYRQFFFELVKKVEHEGSHLRVSRRGGADSQDMSPFPKIRRHVKLGFQPVGQEVAGLLRRELVANPVLLVVALNPAKEHGVVVVKGEVNGLDELDFSRVVAVPR